MSVTTVSPPRRGAVSPPRRGGVAPERPTTSSRTGAGSIPVSPPAAAPAGGRNGLWLLLTVVGVLNLTGLVMVLSASSILSLHQYGSPWHYFEKQIMWLVIGGVSFLVATRLGVDRVRRLARPAMVLTLALLLAVLVPGVGVSTGGASRWLGTSSFQVQPSELMKLVLVIFAADVLDRRGPRRSRRANWKYQMGPVLGATALIVVLVMAQPDMGTTMVMAVIVLTLLFTAGMPMRPLGVGLLGAGVVGLGVAKAAPYRWARMISFLHPLAHASDTGYQAVQGLAAISSGGLFGAGLGSSIASYGYLPNAQTDFIFAVICEETGLAGGVMLVGFFVALAMVGMRIACRASDRYRALLAVGLTAWLVGQAFINIGAVVGVLPVTGVPLPFVSFGGSSLVIALFGIGLLADVARRP